MTIEEIIQKIEAEQRKSSVETQSAAGLVRLQEIAIQYEGEDRLVWSTDLQEEMLTRPRQRLFTSKLPLLDELIGGFKEQQVITLSAHSKHGKTAFSIFMLGQFEELNPVMIPLEQSNEEIISQRMDSNYSIPRFLSPRRLASKVTVDWIENRVIEGIAKHNTKLVVIDHLGYIDDFGKDGELKRENHSYRIETIMKGLKTIAKRWNVVILLNVHISQSDEGKPPTLQDLKGSSSILQESDMVIMLWRKNYLKNKIRIYENNTLLSVLANRRTGRNGSLGLMFDTNKGIYQEENSWVNSLMRDSELQAKSELFDA